MSTRSKFERQLGLREVGFSVKIPDVGRSLKPFDYIVGVPISIRGVHTLRYIAIEAKTARGWTMPASYMLEHQVRALNAVDDLSRNSAWLAIGFLSLPKMKRNYDGTALDRPVNKQAFLLPWADVKSIMGELSLKYSDIIDSNYLKSFWMDYRKIRSSYKWVLRNEHPFYARIAH